MMPLSSYKDLLRELEWDSNKRGKERWYIFLLMNPFNQTNAGVDIIKNLSYLNRRTGDVTFFLPGFSNMPDETLIGPFPSSDDSRVIYRDETFGELYFDKEGFLDTIEWLEKGSEGKYQYSEGLDLVLVKYDPNHKRRFCGIKRYSWGLKRKDYRYNSEYESCFNRQRLLYYKLDYLSERGINILSFIMECMRIVSRSFDQETVKYRLNEISYRPIYGENVTRMNVFVAGAKDLEKERNAVIAALNYVNSQTPANFSICPRSFEYSDRSLALEGRQEDYNRFIREEADYVIFILDNRVGAITFEEFEVAMRSYKEFERPKIYVYSRRNDYSLETTPTKDSEHISDVQRIRNYLSCIGQYYDEYSDLNNLKSSVIRDYLSLSIRMLNARYY